MKEITEESASVGLLLATALLHLTLSEERHNESKDHNALPQPGLEAGRLKQSINQSINKLYIAQNAHCSRDIYLQCTKYLRSVISPIIIQINAS